MRTAVLLAVLPMVAGAAQHRETLLYNFDVDPGEWRYFEFPAKETESRLEVRFEAQSRAETQGVRVRVFRDEEFERFRQNQQVTPLTATSYRRRGHLAAKLAPGNYVVVVENRPEGRRRSRVDLEVYVYTGPDPETLPVAYASPRTRLVVVGISLAVFAAILALAGGALWRAARANRPRTPPGPLVWS